MADLIGLCLAACTLQIDFLFNPGFAKDVMAPSNSHFKTQAQERLPEVVECMAASDVPLNTRCSVLPDPMPTFYNKMLMENKWSDALVTFGAADSLWGHRIGQKEGARLYCPYVAGQYDHAPSSHRCRNQLMIGGTVILFRSKHRGWVQAAKRVPVLNLSLLPQRLVEILKVEFPSSVHVNDF